MDRATARFYSVPQKSELGTWVLVYAIIVLRLFGKDWLQVGYALAASMSCEFGLGRFIKTKQAQTIRRLKFESG